MGFCADNLSFLNYLDENKLISCLTSFTFIVIFAFIYILKAYTFFDNRRIPRGVRPTAPFGNIQDVLFQETTLYVFLWKYYNKFKRKGYHYGGLYLFFKPSVLIINPKLLKSLHQTSVCDANEVFYAEKMSEIIDVFNDENLENFLIKYNVIKESLVTDLNDKNVTTVIHNFFMETTSTAFGFKTSEEFLTVINSLLNKKCNSGFMHYFGLVYSLFQRNVNATEEMHCLIKKIIEYRKKNDVREKDLIQCFADLCSDGRCSLRDVVPEVFHIFVDNIIYSYTSLLFCLYELASNKDVQKDLFEEIRRFNKENKSINLKDVRRLPYLDAVVKETLRKYPAVPTIIKKCKEDYKNSEFGLELPKGTFILYSIMGVHHDPTNYHQPEKFDPDRFLEEIIDCSESDAYIPFGMDMWKNLGLRFTTLHIKLALINILSSYTVSLKDSSSLEFDSKKLPIYPREPLPIHFEPV